MGFVEFITKSHHVEHPGAHGGHIYAFDMHGDPIYGKAPQHEQHADPWPHTALAQEIPPVNHSEMGDMHYHWAKGKHGHYLIAPRKRHPQSSAPPMHYGYDVYFKHPDHVPLPVEEYWTLRNSGRKGFEQAQRSLLPHLGTVAYWPPDPADGDRAHGYTLTTRIAGALGDPARLTNRLDDPMMRWGDADKMMNRHHLPTVDPERHADPPTLREGINTIIARHEAALEAHQGDLNRFIREQHGRAASDDDLPYVGKSFRSVLAKSQATGPGSHGSYHWYLDYNGKVVYGDPPHPTPKKALHEEWDAQEIDPKEHGLHVWHQGRHQRYLFKYYPQGGTVGFAFHEHGPIDHAEGKMGEKDYGLPYVGRISNRGTLAPSDPTPYRMYSAGGTSYPNDEEFLQHYLDEKYPGWREQVDRGLDFGPVHTAHATGEEARIALVEHVEEALDMYHKWVMDQVVGPHDEAAPADDKDLPYVGKSFGAYLTKSQATGPGAHGSHKWYVDDHGSVQYGERPILRRIYTAPTDDVPEDEQHHWYTSGQGTAVYGRKPTYQGKREVGETWRDEEALPHAIRGGHYFYQGKNLRFILAPDVDENDGWEVHALTDQGPQRVGYIHNRRDHPGRMYNGRTVIDDVNIQSHERGDWGEKPPGYDPRHPHLTAISQYRSAFRPHRYASVAEGNPTGNMHPDELARLDERGYVYHRGDRLRHIVNRLPDYDGQGRYFRNAETILDAQKRMADDADSYVEKLRNLPDEQLDDEFAEGLPELDADYEPYVRGRDSLKMNEPTEKSFAGFLRKGKILPFKPREGSRVGPHGGRYYTTPSGEKHYVSAHDLPAEEGERRCTQCGKRLHALTTGTLCGWCHNEDTEKSFGNYLHKSHHVEHPGLHHGHIYGFDTKGEPIYGEPPQHEIKVKENWPAGSVIAEEIPAREQDDGLKARFHWTKGKHGHYLIAPNYRDTRSTMSQLEYDYDVFFKHPDHVPPKAADYWARRMEGRAGFEAAQRTLLPQIGTIGYRPLSPTDRQATAVASTGGAHVVWSRINGALGVRSQLMDFFDDEDEHARNRHHLPMQDHFGPSHHTNSLHDGITWLIDRHERALDQKMADLPKMIEDAGRDARDDRPYTGEVEKSFRGFLRKSEKTGPGSHGSTKWYVDRHGEVHYGDQPVYHGKRKHQETWDAPEVGEGHRWHQTGYGGFRFLFTPHGEVHHLSDSSPHSYVGHVEDTGKTLPRSGQKLWHLHMNMKDGFGIDAPTVNMTHELNGERDFMMEVIAEWAGAHLQDKIEDERKKASEDLDKSLRPEDVIHNPGSHGATKWYVNNTGRVVYGDRAQVYQNKKPGDLWIANEFHPKDEEGYFMRRPGGSLLNSHRAHHLHWWMQGENARFLWTPHGQIHMLTEKPYEHQEHVVMTEPVGAIVESGSPMVNSVRGRALAEQEGRKPTFQHKGVWDNLGNRYNFEAEPHEQNVWDHLRDSEAYAEAKTHTAYDYYPPIHDHGIMLSPVEHHRALYVSHLADHFLSRLRRRAMGEPTTTEEEKALIEAYQASLEKSLQSPGEPLEKARKTGPGSHGSHFWYVKPDGKVQYGPEPKPTSGHKPGDTWRAESHKDDRWVQGEYARYLVTRFGTVHHGGDRGHRLGEYIGPTAPNPDLHYGISRAHIKFDLSSKHPAWGDSEFYHVYGKDKEEVLKGLVAHAEAVLKAKHQEAFERADDDAPYLGKSQATGPGSHGSHKWYIDHEGEVVYGERPRPQPRRAVGETWEAEELPEGHHWHQQEHGRFLFTPKGEVFLHAEGADVEHEGKTHDRMEAVGEDRYSTRDVPRTPGLDLLRVGHAFPSPAQRSGRWGGQTWGIFRPLTRAALHAVPDPEGLPDDASDDEIDGYIAQGRERHSSMRGMQKWVAMLANHELACRAWMAMNPEPEEGTEKSFRGFLKKSQVEGPGAHGSHEWYINRHGKVIYGPQPVHQGQRQHGERWDAELPGHRYHQGEYARYLLTPDQEVLMQTEKGWLRAGHVGDWRQEAPDDKFAQQASRQARNLFIVKTRLNDLFRDLGHAHSAVLANQDAHTTKHYIPGEGSEFIIAASENEMRHKMRQMRGEPDPDEGIRPTRADWEEYFGAVERGEEPPFSILDRYKKSFAGVLQKSKAEGPGSHGSHEWYIAKNGKVVYGPPPKHRQMQPWTSEAAEIPRHHWVQGQYGRYLVDEKGGHVLLMNGDRAMLVGLVSKLRRKHTAKEFTHESIHYVESHLNPENMTHLAPLEEIKRNPRNYPDRARAHDSFDEAKDFLIDTTDAMLAKKFRESGLGKSFRGFLKKSQATGPGSHGSHKWYVSNTGEVVYGDRPQQHRDLAIGDLKHAPELPGEHYWHRGKHGLYLETPPRLGSLGQTHFSEVYHVGGDRLQQVGVISHHGTHAGAFTTLRGALGDPEWIISPERDKGIMYDEIPEHMRGKPMIDGDDGAITQHETALKAVRHLIARHTEALDERMKDAFSQS